MKEKFKCSQSFESIESAEYSESLLGLPKPVRGSAFWIGRLEVPRFDILSLNKDDLVA